MAEDDLRAEQGAEQPSLFAPETAIPVKQPRSAVVEIPPPTGATALGACALPYQDYLRRTDHTHATIICFLSDLRMLTEFLGYQTLARAVTQERLGAWLEHLRHGREARPAPKTMARRVTFLKNFFGWLREIGALERDPTERIILSRPAPPLPELLHEDEVTRLETAAATDVRCHALVTLILSTGLKKEEVMALTLSRVDLSDPERPAIEVRFPGQAKRWRERRMELPAAWTDIYQRYLQRWQPRERVFECTDRNLNYVLAGAVRRAGIEKRVTLQLLRDIYAARQLRAGVALETLRERLGLSEEAWYETAEKYRKLAFPA
ncbi:MAG: tyrosine-type recombinase/integrase [Chloroflexota bacterium]|nr:tyrosine-type recombinase/integrase [Chloroflexota bacterium]